MRQAWQTVVNGLAGRCAAAGLDLVQPFDVAWYNRIVDGAFKLPDLGRTSALGILVGHTRALWDRLVEAIRENPRALDENHPLDAYVRAAVRDALRPLAQRCEVRFADEPPPRRIAMQRLAHVSGLAHLSPSHLCVHPTYGPWIALRAAVVVEVDGPSVPPELSTPCPDCERDCMPMFRRAIAAGAPQDHAAIERNWELWLAVRDACPVGRSYRYSDDQIRYHYAKDRDAILRALQRGR